jgi:UDP-glucose 4-epimerase
MTWLLTGGAGYIGAHIVRVLREAGKDVAVIDDMTSGVRDRVPADVPVVEASVLDTQAVRRAMREHRVTGVVHLAAKKAVGESMEQPLLYYRENVGGMETLLRAMVEEGVSRMVFSSSAAVYGIPGVELVDEKTAPHPISPYGETKLICEWLLAAAGRAHGISWIAQRYFNPVGCADATLGDTSVANLVPLSFRALDEGGAPKIFGDDYPTADGTCIRDYIHVVDLAAAHVSAAERLETQQCADIYNVGRGEGVSVRQVLDVVARITGKDFEPEVVGRRAGDPPAYFADPSAIERDLGWRAERGLDEMVQSSWDAWKSTTTASR